MTYGSEGLLPHILGSPATKMASAEYRALARDLGRASLDLAPIRLILLSSYTAELFEPFLIVEGARHGLEVEVFHGGFGQLEQALLSKDWRAADGRTEVLVAAIRLEDLDPDVSFRFHSKERSAFDSFASDLLDRLDSLLSIFRAASAGPMLVANFAVPMPSPLSVFDANDPHSLTHKIHALNRALAERVGDRAGQYVWDYAGLVTSSGSADWTDARLWALGRVPVAGPKLPLLANHLMRSVRAVSFPSSKCLVVDLDDTLWGGAIGDDGVGGVLLGDEYPGSAFKRFQRAILGLRDRGIMLAICSSNDAEVALKALDEHPEMLVRRGDFAAMRINWSPKSENLRAIAKELNIGSDSLVFFDDNPVVRAEVRNRAPEVLVVDVPTDPALYVEALAGVVQFDTPTLTSEDRLRAQTVGASREWQRVRDGAGSLAEFLASLDMRTEVGAMDRHTTRRVAQLIAKTNQFNLTTRRHTEAQLEQMGGGGGAEVFWLRLSDRYGDMGLVAVAILMIDGSEAVIDSLVLSCRAASRGIEQTMVAQLVVAARGAGASVLVGEYIPTERNHVVKDLYPSLGFSEEVGDGEAKRYRLDLTSFDVSAPDFIKVTSPNVDEESHAQDR